MATGRNTDAPTAPIDRTVAGLAARQVAHSAVADLIGKTRGFALEDALAQAGRNAGLDAADAGLARAIATATFRRLGFLRRVLAERMAQGLPEDQPRLVALLATGAVQILDLNVPDHAAVDLGVRLAKADPQLQHLTGLVNAILRRIVREREAIVANPGDPLSDNTPDWLARRWRAAYGDETARAIAAAHLQGAALDITVRGSAAEWAERLGGVALPTGSVRLHEVRSAVADLPGYAEGQWWVQDAAAALPARLLAVTPGERVADLCAAPGGKTAQLAAAGASVLAVDRSSPRLERLSQNFARLGLEAEIRVGDALSMPEEGAFDAVLLDAPCSATGTLRRHPDVAWTKTESDISRLIGLQKRLFDKAAALVRPGGRLVYCTCSLEREEGEYQVATFLTRNPDFERVPVQASELGGLSEPIDAAGDLRTLPAHLTGEAPELRGGLDGFFASRLRRKG
ncbi:MULTISPECIES: RsmB/NOP family class I SAM-dependent RNA methyltransferase [unclassified Methylobacterium]|uniref:RsmB/NOP family class I SAM-dependent RNA methyltransferase n=1 Tax=unclassified Methylobacterium TaxID=2615210 RepID=UPI0006FF6EC6|nr:MULTISPECIES: RsmB/NOP family class I SAM-dependent RNA methyltransferase [unclassified Methylobacterium]KQP80911.1 MFS transporter [Methylobacterium sp. Leaf117]MCK2054907.1 RsmB/NOP family class I SAM-dependent RNA methyltransferase [Methylobacterium sp. 37f]